MRGPPTPTAGHPRETDHMPRYASRSGMAARTPRLPTACDALTGASQEITAIDSTQVPPGHPSDRFKRFVRAQWIRDAYDVARPYRAAANHDRHHARLAYERAIRIPVQDRLHQAWPQAVKLHARVSQPGEDRK